MAHGGLGGLWLKMQLAQSSSGKWEKAACSPLEVHEGLGVPGWCERASVSRIGT